MGAYYWNRAVPSEDVELWHGILSFWEVSVSFSLAFEAETAVAQLKHLWKSESFAWLEACYGIGATLYREE